MEAGFRFAQLVETFRQQIEAGTLQAGERLPSVRSLSRERGVSLSTAFRAYYELEARGLVVARPQSGYYVRAWVRSEARAVPQPSQPQPQASPVSVSHALRTFAKGWVRPDLIDLSVAVPALSLLPQARLNKTVQETLRSLPDSGLNYEYSGGLPDLRRQVARHLALSGSLVEPDNVLITSGCLEAIGLALRAITKPGDAVAVESPTYYGILQVLERLGLCAYELPTHAETGPDLTALEQALTTQPIRAVVLTPSFSNPTGYAMPDAHKAQLATLLDRHGVPLVEDDIYGDLYFGKKRPRTIHSFCESGRVLLCGSVSKTLAPGYRVGWLASGRYHEAVQHARLMETIAPAPLVQAAVARFMQQGRYERHLRTLRATFQQHLLAYADAVRAAFPVGTRVSQPTGGFVLWVELPPGTLPVSALLEQALSQQITFFPGYLFSAQPQYANCLRIACGHPFTARYADGLRQLGQLAQP
jgi:DNA-binding transcriptional MocR family regulator